MHGHLNVKLILHVSALYGCLPQGSLKFNCLQIEVTMNITKLNKDLPAIF